MNSFKLDLVAVLRFSVILLQHQQPLLEMFHVRLPYSRFVTLCSHYYDLLNLHYLREL